MSQKPEETTGPGNFEAFMETQRRQTADAIQESQQPAPQTEEEVLAAVLMDASGDSPARAAIAKIRASQPCRS